MLPIASLREQIHTEHVRIARAIAEQQQRHDHVHRQRQRADHAHGLRLGTVTGDEAVNRVADDPQAETKHGRRLEQRGPGPPRQCEARHAKSDGVVGRIAEEVERIGLQRPRIRRHPGDDFDHEHGSVRGQRDPQDQPPARVIVRALVRLRCLAAGLAHVWSLQCSSHDCICTL